MLKKLLIYPVAFMFALIMLLLEGFVKLLQLLPNHEDKKQ